MFETLDVNSVLENTEKPSYHLQYKGPGVDQVQCRHGSSYDSPTCVEAFSLRKVSAFTVANGQDIPNFDRAKFQTVDEFGNKRKMEGHVTGVHKPLASAREISKYHDAFFFEELGTLIPRHSRVAEGLRQEYHRLCQKCFFIFVGKRAAGPEAIKGRKEGKSAGHQERLQEFEPWNVGESEAAEARPAEFVVGNEDDDEFEEPKTSER